MIKFYKNSLLITTLLCLVLNGYAQEDVSKSGEIADRQVVIVKDRQNNIDPAERISEKASLPDEPPSEREFNHSLSEPSVKLPPMDLHFSVNKVEAPKLPKLYGNYVRGGYGNKQSSYLDGWFHTTRSKKLSLGASVHHLASGLGDTKFSDNKICLNTKHFIKKLKIETMGFYLRNRINLYGSPYSSEDSIKKVSNQGGIGLGFGNIPEKDEKLQWDGNVNVNHYENTYNKNEMSENDGNLFLMANYKMNETSVLKLQFLNNTGSQKEDTISVFSQLNVIQPQYHYSTSLFSLNAGFKFAYYSDDDTSNKGFYPDIYFEWYAIKEKLTVLSAINGTMKRDNFRTVNSENQFLGKVNRLSYSETPLNIDAGLRFFLEEKLSISSVYSISFNETQYFYFPVNKNYVVYYQDSISIQKLKNILSYNPLPNLQTSVAFSWYNYQPKGDTAWFKPELELGLNLKYNMGKKIYAGMDVFWLNGMKAPNKKLETTITDINLNLEYRFSNRFSAFAEAYNILSQRYEFYNYYKVNGITVIGGLSYTF